MVPAYLSSVQHAGVLVRGGGMLEWSGPVFGRSGVNIVRGAQTVAGFADFCGRNRPAPNPAALI